MLFFYILRYLKQFIICDDAIIVDVTKPEAETNLVILRGQSDGGEEGHEVIKCDSPTAGDVDAAEDNVSILARFSKREDLCVDLFECVLISDALRTLLLECSVKLLDLA